MKGKIFQSYWQSHQQESLIQTLMSWVPLTIGRVLRRLTYRTILAKLGQSVAIQPGVEFVCAKQIEIGNEVKLERDVRLRVFGLGSKLLIRNQVHLDRGVDIKIHNNGFVEIGEHTYIGPYTCLSGNWIKIGKDCLIASHSGIYANNHKFSDPIVKIREQGNTYEGIVIEDNCWLGSGVKVLDGVIIRQGSVIGAGAVVTKDIPPYSVAVGVPAKVVAQRNVIDQQKFKQRLVEQLLARLRD
jgi:acetyltransferase-like isoleucine patch superfamily enzyme